MTLLGSGPFGLLQFYSQPHPLVHELPESLVVPHLAAHGGDLIGPHKPAGALAGPDIAQLIVGPVLARLLGVFAAARRVPTDVELFPEAAGVHRPHLRQALLDLLDPSLDWAGCHDDSLAVLSAFVN